MERPTGVTVLGVVAIITGVLQVIWSGVFFGILKMLPGLTITPGAAMFAGWSLLILGVLGVVYGIGALGLMSWSWITGVVVSILDILVAIYAASAARFAGEVTVASIILVILSIVMLVYLYMNEVRAALGHERHMPTGAPTHA